MQSKINHIVLIGFLLLFNVTSFAQNYQTKRLKSYYNHQNYELAYKEGARVIARYEKKKDASLLQELYLYTAASLVKLNMPQESLPYFQKLEKVEGEFQYMYIDVLIQERMFKEAIAELKKIKKKTEKGKMLFSQCNFALQLNKEATHKELEQADQISNTKHYYGMTVAGGHLLVSKQVKKSNYLNSVNKEVRNQYSFVIQDVNDEKFKDYFKNIDLLNISYPTLDTIRQILYFSANFDSKVYATNYFSENKKLNKDRTNTLVIYSLELETRKLEMLPFIKSEYNYTHPTITDRGNTIYFASDKAGGVGGFDIYCAKRNKYSWANPTPVKAINTPMNDAYPVFQNDMLYYASKGNEKCYGGYDIYAYDPLREKIRTFKAPMNSSHDDLQLIRKDENEAYLVSNRGEGEGDKIFKWKQEDEEAASKIGAKAENTDRKEVQILLIDYVSEEYIPMVYVEFDGLSKGEVVLETSDDQGGVNTTLPQDTYTVYVQKEGYLNDTLMLRVDEKVRDFYVFSLRPNIEKGNVLTLRSIFFQLNQFKLSQDSYRVLDNFVYMLMDYPDVHVEIGSHTDSQGDDLYNLNLSKKRARYTMNYLIEKGIDASRLTYRGFGETRLLNSCDDGVDCDDQEHELNRRVEFRIVK